MDGITKTTKFARRHSTIESRLAGIASSLFVDRPVTLADEDEPAANRDARTITLVRGESAELAFAGAGGALT